MKKIIYILFIFHISLLTTNSQWVAQYNPSTINLQDVTFINRYTGWVCGDGSQILRTTNGGVNWVLQNSGVSGKILTGIHAVDSQYVYCVGWWQTVLKTTDGGNNWIILRNGPQPPPQVGSFYGLYFFNRTTGWLLRNEYVLRTTNGGISFDSTHINFSYLRDVYFKDAITGVMCTDFAGIFKSTNGGVNWIQKIVPVGTEGADFFKESFIGNYGWVVGRAGIQSLGHKVYRTTDFGDTWDSLGRIPMPAESETYCSFFTSLSTGWSGGSYGHIFKTTNGGYNWLEQSVPSNYFRRSMWFYNDTIGWAVGGGGQILHTTNGGYLIPGNLLFCDNFENGLDKWIINTISGCPWSIKVIPQRYNLPFTANGNCLSADADLCGPSGGGSTGKATSITIDCTNQQEVYGEFDHDWYPDFSSYDTAKVQASYDGGANWEDVLIFTNINRAAHRIFQLPEATNIPNLKIRLYSIQPGYDFWWAVDNFCIRGYDMVGINNNQHGVPKLYELFQNYPNPFNATTVIRYSIPKIGNVKLIVYDAIGREVKILVNETKTAGTYKVIFYAENLASGIYFYRLEAGAFLASRKLILMK